MNTINLKSLRVLAVCSVGLIFTACGKQEQPTAEAEMSSAPVEVAAKIPVTTASAEARDLYMQGVALADDLHATDAHSMFTKAVAADPHFAMAYMQVAQSSLSTAEFFAAVDSAKATAAGASEGEQLIIAALAAAAENDQAGQLGALTKLLAMYPQDERAHVRMANYANGQQDFASAIAHFTHATEINPDFAVAFNGLGYAHRSAGNLDGAKAAFAKYIELRPEEANPYDSYAELVMEVGDYDAAIENYSKAVEIDANFLSAYAGLSISHSLKGEADLAQEAAASMLAAARNPGERRNAMFQSATSYLFAEDNDAAIAVLEMMLADALENGDHAAAGGILEYMGDIMLVAGNVEKANEYIDGALDHRMLAGFNEANQAQANRTHLYKSSIAAMIADDNETAADRAAEYAAAAEMHGTTFEKRRAHELAGYIAMGNGDHETGLTELAQANQLNPVVLYWTAYAHNELGNTEQAMDFANRAANKNTLSGNLPFFRNDALALLAELSAE